MTALDWAVSQEHEEIAALLRRAAETVDDAEVTEVSQPAPATSAPAAATATPTPSPTPTVQAEPMPLLPAADLKCLRQALEFDASTVKYKDNVFAERYYIKPEFPIHASSTSVVVAALDFGLSVDYEEVFKLHCKKKDASSPKAQLKMTSSSFQACYEALQTSSAPYQHPPLVTRKTADELFARYAKESTTGIFMAQHEFVQMCKDLLGATRDVAIKFMRDEAPCRWESNIRQLGQLQSCYVVGAIGAVSEGELRAAAKALVVADPSGTVRRMQYFPHPLVMPAADRSLDSILRQERPDTAYTREIMRQVAEALQHLHQHGVMHGDLYALNIIRIGGRMALVDLDAAVEFGDAGSVTGAKFSSGVLPPEMFATLTREQEEEFEEYWREDVDSNSELWGKICPVKLRNGSAIVVRTVHPDRADGSGLPYDLVNASDMVDIWSYGLLLYCAMNPTGNSLFSVNQDGDLVRTEENFNAAANWTDDEISNAILHNIPDPLAADLLQKILRRNPAQRSDVTSILAHPFFTDPSAKKRDAKVCQISILKQRKLMLKRDQQAEAIYHCTEHVVDVSDEAFLQIKKTDTVLLRSVFDTAEAAVPTCFILVDRKIVSADASPAAGAITSANWIENLSDLSNTDEEKYLYLLDEFTMQPILTAPVGKDAAHTEYPFTIRHPSEFVPAVLPLLLLSMKATAMLHGTASLTNSLGHPDPPVPLSQAVAWTGSLDTSTSLLEFSNLMDGAEEATAHLTGYNNHTPEAVKVRAAYVRDSALKELRNLYAEHTVLYTHSEADHASFCGLRRVVVPGGFMCWTQEENARNIKAGMSAVTHLRLNESLA
jgi:serine/threonine protein kinase